MKYLSDAHQTLKTDIAVTKRAADKTDVDMMAAQTEKKEQVGLLECIKTYGNIS